MPKAVRSCGKSVREKQRSRRIMMEKEEFMVSGLHISRG